MHVVEQHFQLSRLLSHNFRVVVSLISFLCMRSVNFDMVSFKFSFSCVADVEEEKHSSNEWGEKFQAWRIDGRERLFRTELRSRERIQCAHSGVIC